MDDSSQLLEIQTSPKTKLRFSSAPSSLRNRAGESGGAFARRRSSASSVLGLQLRVDELLKDTAKGELGVLSGSDPAMASTRYTDRLVRYSSTPSVRQTSVPPTDVQQTSVPSSPIMLQETLPKKESVEFPHHMPSSDLGLGAPSQNFPHSSNVISPSILTTRFVEGEDVGRRDLYAFSQGHLQEKIMHQEHEGAVLQKTGRWMFALFVVVVAMLNVPFMVATMVSDHNAETTLKILSLTSIFLNFLITVGITVGVFYFRNTSAIKARGRPYLVQLFVSGLACYPVVVLGVFELWGDVFDAATCQDQKDFIEPAFDRLVAVLRLCLLFFISAQVSRLRLLYLLFMKVRVTKGLVEYFKPTILILLVYVCTEIPSFFIPRTSLKGNVYMFVSTFGWTTVYTILLSYYVWKTRSVMAFFSDYHQNVRSLLATSVLQYGWALAVFLVQVQCSTVIMSNYIIIALVNLFLLDSFAVTIFRLSRMHPPIESKGDIHHPNAFNPHVLQPIRSE